MNETVENTALESDISNSASDWQLIQANTLKEVHDQVVDVFSNTYHDAFEDEWMGVNHNLHVELRGLKFVDGWVTGFLLTPWMLCSIYIPVMQVPDLDVDADWLATEKAGQEYVVIGPLKEFSIGGAAQKANLNYDSRIGHYLLQPLVQIMDKYADNADAFAAWSQVIDFRKEYYEKLEQAQKEAEEQAIQKANQKAQDGSDSDSAQDDEPLDRRAFLSKWL